jgi:hypothetical protein
MANQNEISEALRQTKANAGGFHSFKLFMAINSKKAPFGH